MSGYPDPNYGPLPTYDSTIGESCNNPKPYWYYKGATFCEDVDVNGLTTTSRIIVDGMEFKPTLILNQLDGLYYYVLASDALPSNFVPPTS